jgi:hypothetical protein
MKGVTEQRKVFLCIGYHMACTPARPDGPGFLPLWILERTRVYSNRSHTIQYLQRAIRGDSC